MGGLALVFAMASLGLPMMGNFVAEFPDTDRIL
jgi:NADH:ubiquinone oxidoreductase subunit 4 (subunit M)